MVYSIQHNNSPDAVYYYSGFQVFIMDDDETVAALFSSGRDSQKGFQIYKGDDFPPDITDTHYPIGQIGQRCNIGPVANFQGAGKRQGKKRILQSKQDKLVLQTVARALRSA